MSKTKTLTPLEAVNEIRNNNDGQVVLVLQGGGALGAYQGGVYQALHEAGVEPDWIIGTSIGAINAAIIAGNQAEDRLAKLQGFWQRVERATFWGAFPAWAGVADALVSWMTLTSGISGFFEPHTRAFLGAHVPSRRRPCRLLLDRAAAQDAGGTRRFRSLINQGHPRLTVGAAHVRSSMMHYFDSKEMELSPSHIMASGALPPAFPAVRIDGELYWDGGILSNTPTERIFDDQPRRNSLIFAVHLWHPTGEEPETIWQILNRHKDIQYSSRIASHIVRQRETHKLRHVITQLLEFVPEEEKNDPLYQELAGYRCDTRMHVVRLLSPQARQRDPHQGHRFLARGHPPALGGRLRRHHARALSGSPGSASSACSTACILHEPAPGAEPAAEIEPGEP